MGLTKFKLLTQRLLSGLGKTKTFFPFYDSENDADYRVSLDTLITFISNELGVSSKAVFELTGVTNTGNDYVSTLSINSYKTEGLYIFKPSVDSDNVTTLNVNSVGILNIKEFNGTDLVDKSDLKAVNTYLLLNKTSYWLIVGGVSGGSGGVSTFSALTDSPYDNTELATALNSKQDRLAGIVSGCVITVETFVGVGTNKQIRVTDGTWYIPTSEYTKATDTVSSEITLCPTGGDFKYYDVVADNTGAITIHEGTPSTAPAHYVINPLTEVLLGFITVGDAVIEEPAVSVDSLTKKFEGFGVLTGSFTLNCDSHDFPVFFFRLGGAAATLSFSNYWNVVEGTMYIDVNSTTILNLPTGSYESGNVITSKTLLAGYYYRVKFGYLYGEYFFDFGVAGGSGTTDLSITNRTATTLDVASSTGVAATIPQATPSLAGLQSATDKTKADNTTNVNSGDETAARIGALLTLDTTPLDTDLVVSWDGTFLLKTTWDNIKAFFKTYYDTLYANRVNNTQNTAILFWENGIGEDLAGFYYDRTNKILNVKGTVPTIKVLNVDGSYSQLDRLQTANTFKLRNYVLQAGGIGKALVLNGTNQYATASGTGLYTNGGSFSCSVWVKSSAIGASCIVELGTQSSQGIGISRDNDGTMTFNTSSGATNSATQISNGSWHHILACFGSGNLSVYIDSVLRINLSIAINITAGTLRIGNSLTMFGSTTYYGGTIDQVVVWGSKLTATDAVNIYNSGAGNATIPASPTRRYEIEEGSGSILVDSSVALVNATLFNSPIWTSAGKVPVSGAGIESTIIESSDGLTNGERGLHKFGEFNGTTQIQGRFIRGLIDIYYWFITDSVGNVLFDSGNTSTGALPTAKVTVGASTALLAGFRLVAGVLNTSSINLGDFVHNLSQRTIFKRKGSTTANSLWLSESDIHFTQTNSKTVTNTVTATSLIGTLVTGQTLTFPADFWVAGKMEQIEIEGVLSNLITDSLLLDLTLGGTNISTSGANVLGAAFTNTRFKLTLNIKCETVGASGTFLVTGEFRYTTALGTESIWSMTKVGTTTINTTIALALDVKATWGAASTSNTITSYNSKGLILN